MKNFNVTVMYDGKAIEIDRADMEALMAMAAYEARNRASKLDTAQKAPEKQYYEDLRTLALSIANVVE